MKFRPFILHTVCALATIIYSYIHTSCDAIWSTESLTKSELCVTKLSDCSVVYYTVCWRWSEPLSFCQVNQSANLCGAAGVKQEQNCLASRGGETCFCGVTKYLHVISVLYRPTQAAVCYTECSVLGKHSLADVGKVIIRGDETLIIMYFIGYEKSYHWCGGHIKCLDWNHVSIRALFIITAHLWLTHSDAKSKDSVNIHF